jgi:hypothetical protein
MFNIKAQAAIKPPVNVYPADKQSISLDEAKRGITFKWKLVEPGQRGVTYRLRVWQLMETQNGTQAMNNNRPMIDRDVTDAPETTWPSLLTGPCKPPYLCDFIWNVEASLKNAAGIAEVIGTSTPTMFAVSQYIIQIDSIKVNCTEKPGVYSFSYSLTNPNAGPATLNLFTVTSSAPAGATIASFSPPINTTIAPGNMLTITGTINAAPNLSNICIGAEIKDVGNAFWKASKDTCIDVGPCKCDACDSVKIDVVQKDIKFDANGNIILNTTISVSPKPVKSVKTELVYYEYKPKSDECMLCNKDSKTFGNFDNGTLGNTTGIGGGTHSQQWDFVPPKNLTGGSPGSLTITCRLL